MEKNKSRIWIGTLILLTVIVTVIYLLLSSSSKKHANQLSYVETVPITLNNYQPLYNAMLAEQYNGVYYDLSTFIQTKIDPKISSATLSQLSVSSDGTITFTISIDKPKVSFVESVDRHQWDKLIINISKYKYSKTVNIY
jgi:hypothetical protein